MSVPLYHLKLIHDSCCFAKDYAVVIIMGVFIYAGLHWVISARRWFKGPVKTVDGFSSLSDSMGVTEEKQVTQYKSS